MSHGFGLGPYGVGPFDGGRTFTPPMRKQVVVMERSLRYSFDVCSTVWKDAEGVWHAHEVPYDGDLATAQVVLTATGPIEVDDATANELIAAGIGTIS